jgi:hypothetical protein
MIFIELEQRCASNMWLWWRYAGPVFPLSCLLAQLCRHRSDLVGNASHSCKLTQDVPDVSL